MKPAVQVDPARSTGLADGDRGTDGVCHVEPVGTHAIPDTADTFGGGDTHVAHDAQAAVSDWLLQARHTADPVRVAVIEGLARRARAHAGAVGQRLLQRAEQLIGGPARQTPHAAGDREPAAAAARASILQALSAQIDRLGRTPSALPAPAAGAVAARPAARGAPPATTTAATRAKPHPSRRAIDNPPAPLKAVTAFKGTWSRLRAEQRLRQALAQVPAQAGPLNSSQVVYRALQEIHALSPAYLDAFMAHVDALLALEQAGGAADLTTRATARPDSDKRSGTRAARKGPGPGSAGRP